MKKCIVLGLIIIGITANAQFKYGFGAGANMSYIDGSVVKETDSRLGFNGGFIAEVKLPVKIGFEANLMFSTKGANTIVVDNITPNSIGETEMFLSYVDLPVVVKLYTAKVLSFQLGAQYSRLLSAKLAGSSIKDMMEPNDMSAVIGLGLDVSKLHASARFNYGLKSIYETGTDVKNNMITFTVGYWMK